GYTAALEIADGWLAKHQDGYKVWSIAGTMLNDWADFEYFQQLSKQDSQARMTAFKEKQNQSQQHFVHAAEAYGRAVPTMAPGNYSVDVYIGWFNSLLGVNS